MHQSRSAESYKPLCFLCFLDCRLEFRTFIARLQLTDDAYTYYCYVTAIVKDDTVNYYRYAAR